MSDYRASNPALQTQDLRELMRRLYREIGMTAVAAELQVSLSAQYSEHVAGQYAQNSAMPQHAHGKAA